MYVFSATNLYKHQHHIWNQIWYEIKEKGLYKSKWVPYIAMKESPMLHGIVSHVIDKILPKEYIVWIRRIKSLRE